MSQATASLDRTAAELAIRRTIAEYCQTVDDGRFEEFAACWAPDARVTVMGDTYSGRDAVRAWIEQAQPPERRGKHCTFEPLVTFDGDQRARAATDFLFVANTPDGPAVSRTGRYLDEFVPHDGRWVFAHREIVLDG